MRKYLLPIIYTLVSIQKVQTYCHFFYFACSHYISVVIALFSKWLLHIVHTECSTGDEQRGIMNNVHTNAGNSISIHWNFVRNVQLSWEWVNQMWNSMLSRHPKDIFFTLWSLINCDRWINCPQLNIKYTEANARVFTTQTFYGTHLLRKINVSRVKIRLTIMNNNLHLK